jgi:U3 small nucleolar RNA-associated protein 25
VEKLAKLLLPAKGQIINKDRFYKEFGEEKDDEGKAETKKSYKPEDFEAVFTGNTDDSFRIGISVAKRTLKVNQNQISQWNYIYFDQMLFLCNL